MTRTSLAVVALLACYCSACFSPAPTPTPTPVRVIVPTSPPEPTTPPSPTSLPLPTLVATPTPVTASAAAPRLPMRIGVDLQPPQPAIGTEFVLRLSVTNDGDRPAHGVYIATSGPWDKYTVLAVLPRGSVARDAAGWHIVSPVEVAPAATLVLEIHARADEPSDERLTFAVREADPQEL